MYRKANNGGGSSAEEKESLVVTDEVLDEEELAVTTDRKSKSGRREHWGPGKFDKDSHCLNIMVRELVMSTGK